jgi:CDP-6-deoxy-D-xylo-4-hexulose-3-dehydrase
MTDRASRLRAQIMDLVGQSHAAQFAAKPFAPGESAIPVSGKVFDAAEIQRLVDASLDFWLTTGRTRSVLSANLPLDGSPRMRPDEVGLLRQPFSDFGPHVPQTGRSPARSSDEIITVAAGFPTTVNPILQNNLVPVFVDVSVPTYNVDPAAHPGRSLRPYARQPVRCHGGLSVCA